MTKQDAIFEFCTAPFLELVRDPKDKEQAQRNGLMIKLL